MKKRYKRRIRSRKQRMRQKIRLGFLVLLLVLASAGMVRCAGSIWSGGRYFELNSEEIDASKPEIDVQLLTVNPYSRPGTKTEKITGVVMHYTANPGATAMENRNYFENLKDSKKTKASSNFVVGLDGEIVQCVPTWEVAYASNNRNRDTVSIECCHPDASGKFNEKTYRSMVQLTAWLCMKFDLTETDVIRHYDVTGKDCPKFFVEDEAAWEQFREDVGTAIQKSG